MGANSALCFLSDGQRAFGKQAIAVVERKAQQASGGVNCQQHLLCLTFSSPSSRACGARLLLCASATWPGSLRHLGAGRLSTICSCDRSIADSEQEVSHSDRRRLERTKWRCDPPAIEQVDPQTRRRQNCLNALGPFQDRCRHAIQDIIQTDRARVAGAADTVTINMKETGVVGGAPVLVHQIESRTGQGCSRAPPGADSSAINRFPRRLNRRKGQIRSRARSNWPRDSSQALGMLRTVAGELPLTSPLNRHCASCLHAPRQLYPLAPVFSPIVRDHARRRTRREATVPAVVWLFAAAFRYSGSVFSSGS